MPNETTSKSSDTPIKPTDAKSASTADPKKQDAPVKTADTKTAPAAATKKQDTPAKSTDTKATPAADPKKQDAPAKAADTKATPAADPKKSDTPTKPVETKSAPAADSKKQDTPAKPTDTKATPAADLQKQDAPAKSTDTKAAPTAEPKKQDTPAKSTDTTATPAADPKKAELPAKSETAIEPPKGVKITQVFTDRLEKPDDKALHDLPTPKEGEAFSMRLHPAYFFDFLEHPFTVNREVADYKELYDSIKMNGINEPVKARPRADGGLELLSGHRRHDIAMQLNYPIPVVIVQMDDDTARIEVVDGNLHRQDIPTSELARAAKMKMEALARKAGRRSKMEQLSTPQKRTDQIVAEDMGMSRNQVNRLVRIDALVPELKKQVDDKKLPFNTAVELSYLKPEEQGEVVDYMRKEEIVPSMAQATALKEVSKKAQEAEKKAAKSEPSKPTAATKPTAPASKPATEPPKPAPVDAKKIASIVKPKAEPEQKYTFTSSELKDYFAGDRLPTVSEVKRKVFDALDLQKQMVEREKSKAALKKGLSR
ncbi:MAG: ParB N-terminal domain-containing protein [Clostridiaceae bacterium]|nr:ParB N-terminal domain-containing protein [Clostridiaceae bacterium]